jgi:hypothetical protein
MRNSLLLLLEGDFKLLLGTRFFFIMEFFLHLLSMNFLLMFLLVLFSFTGEIETFTFFVGEMLRNFAGELDNQEFFGLEIDIFISINFLRSIS